MIDMKIDSDWTLSSVSAHQGPAAGVKSEGGFGGYLKQAIDSVEGLQAEANKAGEDFALGKNTDIHSLMIAMEKASLSFQLMMQVRNKLIGAYEEISRMQV